MDQIDETIGLYGAAEVLVVLEQQVDKASGSVVTPLPVPIRQAFLHANPFSDEVLPAGGDVTTVSFFPRLGVAIGYVDQKGKAALNNQGEVQALYLAPTLTMILGSGSGNPNQDGPSWGLNAFSVPTIWGAEIFGRGVGVCHLDTGADVSHPLLASAVRECVEIGPDGTVTGASGTDDQGHGTHTAAIIAGRQMGAKNFGVAPGSDLYCAKIIGSNSKQRLLGGLEWAIEKKARVLNISMGLVGYSPFFVEVFSRLEGFGILPIVAIGNEGPGTSRSPGNYSQALAVGAIDREYAVWSDSSSIKFDRADDPLKPDLVAPGVDIVSAKRGGGLLADTGTSMAAPFVAGVAALLLEAIPAASPAALRKSITDSAVLAGGMSELRCGHGMVKPVEAMERLRSQHGA